MGAFLEEGVLEEVIDLGGKMAPLMAQIQRGGGDTLQDGRGAEAEPLGDGGWDLCTCRSLCWNAFPSGIRVLAP